MGNIKIIGSREIVVNSDYMKIVVASYYRYQRQIKCVCTEFRHMDICCANNKLIIEIECKISKADLKKEAEKPKHIYYLKNKSNRYSVPNKYYIAITDKMYKDKDCIDFINNLNSDYGIIVVSSWQDIEIKKQAKNLHDKAPSKDIYEDIIARMSSENIGLRKKLYDLKNKKNGA